PEGVRPMELVLLAIAVGVGVGMVVGALGAGGGILAVPVLVFLLGMPPHAATASSLVIVLITALASLPHHARQRNVEWRAGLVFAAVSVAGAVVGSRLSALVPADVLLTLFGIMLAAVAAVMLRRGLRTRRTEDAETAAHGTAPRTDADAAVSSHDEDRKSTRLNSSHVSISYAVFCLKKKNHADNQGNARREGHECASHVKV